MAGLILLIVVMAIAAYFLMRSSLHLSPDELPAAAVGTDYTVTLTVVGNDTPVHDIVLKSGTLPAGLKLTHEENSQDGLIEGTPSETGTFDFVIEVSCMETNLSGGRCERSYTVTVN